MQDFVANLRWRGMVCSATPGIEAQLEKERTTGYVGFDPTAPSLHIGNLAAIMLLKHFQLAGHKPVVILGGATGMVGDPSWKTAERRLLCEEELHYNQTCISKQLQQFLDFSDRKHGAVLLNNMDWFRDMGFLKFLREAGKHISVNYMMAKDSVKRRLETGLSFTEFAYQLLQGYDFYYLYTHHNVKLQMGGADQWGNLTTGTEIIRRKTGNAAFALTTPLITKADGSKFGKTEQGNVWLDPVMTSPYAFYQFWLNCSDEEACKLVMVFTLLDQATIGTLIQTHNAAPHQRTLQKAIAKELTIRVHSEQAYRQAAQAAEILFGNATQGDILTLDEQDLLTIFANVPKITISQEQWRDLTDITDLVSSVTQGIIFKSKGEARRIIQGGGLSINKIRITDPHQKPDFFLLQEKYLLIQQGKKQYYLVVVQ
ncbi:MAG: tyrosine--tRNA ligase [Amoebophilaceae bacterium]|jgi:tyrosyl-tRNA synthetase|nr:tyrosine--tRNA ligase [Amoebophilaceae bacterium]